MFDLDKWQEIFYTIDKNRLRSFITAFNVAWGIFILILLMGFGVGFQNGIKNEFSDNATNTMYFWSGRTSVAHKGMQPGRQIKFTNQDYEAIKERVRGIEFLSGIYWVQGEFVVRYENNYSSFQIRSIDVDYPQIEQSVLLQGRFINIKDLKEKRKVAVVGEKVVEILFKNLDPIGKFITVNGIKYKVVGVFNEKGVEANQFMSKVIFIPRSTAQVAYGGGDRIHNIWLTVGDATIEESNRIKDEVHSLLAERHRFSKDDKRAVDGFSVLEEYQRWMGIFDGIRIFLAFVGILTLVAGIVGVSNIMLIVVKERTREIGVRKAIGASPLSIIGLFLMEALIITLASGYVGMILAMTFIESGWLTSMMVSFGFPESFFINPHVDFSNAVAATLVLAISGTLAGFFPARKAAKIPPIEALRDE